MNISWYISRLRAMSLPEILWRVEQKKLEKAERLAFGKQHIQITEGVFYQGKEDLTFHVEKLPIETMLAMVGEQWTDQISLLGDYDYQKYKKDWHGGFQTDQSWPLVFSYDLQYKQRDQIGDARTNWELNRHFQFALLACDYYRTRDKQYVDQLLDLFEDWNRQNPFLFGISWTSVMEVAIRDINWIYTLGLLELARRETEETEDRISGVCEQLRTGIINMTQYIAGHFSRFSSANNHVIVEAAAMGIAGIVMECGEWLQQATLILQYEIPRQNYGDGVNREVSLHYQSFFMEAVGLLVLTMQHNGINVPVNWRRILRKMSCYVADCQGEHGETVVFGDDDEGKILDLKGSVSYKGEIHVPNHYSNMLKLMELILQEKFARSKASVCYEQGGVSILRSREGRVLIGIDHGELGFGSIAAHGHADALSFQMYLDGEAVFADAGTYIYHVDLDSRNAFRKTLNHNTVTIDGKDQSEMLGAFLWGKRATTTLLGHDFTDQESPIWLEAQHDGYAPVIHKRRFEFDGSQCLIIRDYLTGIEREISYQVNFLLGSGCVPVQKAFGNYEITAGTKGMLQMQIEALHAEMTIAEAWISECYGIRRETKQIQVKGKAEKDVAIVTTIRLQ